MRAANVGGDEIADLLRISTEGARVDDGIIGIGIDISHWEKIPVHSDGSGFFSSDASEILGIFGLTACADGHCVGKTRCPAQAIADA